jgi:predicted ATPase
MFESLRIKNFRSIRDSGEIELSNLNVFVGPNNSGKSSILYALMMIKMTLESKNTDMAMITSTPELDLGSYLDLIRDGNIGHKLMIKFKLNAPSIREPLTISSEYGGGKSNSYAELQTEFDFDRARNKVEVISFVGKDHSGNRIMSVRRTDSSNWKISGPSQRLLKHLHVDFVNFLPIILPFGQKPKDDIAQQVLRWNLVSVERGRSLWQVFDKLRYVAPIRERIPRYGVVGTMVYSELSPSGQNLMRVLSSSDIIGARGKAAIDELNYWLGGKFKLLKNIDLIDIDQAGTVKTLIADDPRGSKKVNLASMGCGISQLVPVVVQTVLLPKSGCLLVEQPEIHLHPSAQASLADLFVENTKGRRQFIIETHSEHFVLRLRRRIAEGKIKPEKIRIFFVEKKRGLTRIQRLNLKPNGHFEEWPSGFFEEGFKEALAIAEAGIVSTTQEG